VGSVGRVGRGVDGERLRQRGSTQPTDLYIIKSSSLIEGKNHTLIQQCLNFKILLTHKKIINN
jgi:hypothetical protein